MSDENPTIQFLPKPTTYCFVDLEGQNFGRLTVLGHVGRRGNGRHAHWLCRCECNNEAIVQGKHLRSGHTQSCGCWRRDVQTTHGQAPGSGRSKTYAIWNRMVDRCTNPAATCFHRYGGRGIMVCPQWRRFENFFADMGARPSLQHSLDRIDNDGNYEPSNCRWATPREQANNTSRNRKLTWQGRTQTIAEWSRELGIKYSTLNNRRHKNYTIEQIMSPTHFKCGLGAPNVVK